MTNRLTGALVRAALLMMVLVTPSAMLSGVDPGGREMVALIALFSGVLAFVEYNATYPGLIEFRDAPPFNRIRFLMLLSTVVLLTLILRGEEDRTTLTIFLRSLGEVIGTVMDFPFSPVSLITQMTSDGAADEAAATARIAAGMSYMISLVWLFVFVLVTRVSSWPTRSGAFNVWVNLPTFDPSAGGDVVDRLDRDARINIALGFLLPFLIPLLVKVASFGVAPLSSTSPQTLIWMMTAWSFLPASLFMRGIAMGRVAEMIRERRRLNILEEAASLAPA